MTVTTDGTRRTEYLAVVDLVGAPRNPKRHADKAIGSSIARWGYVEPVVLDERTGRLVAGHGRVAHLIEAEAAGVDVPDGISVDADGRWMVPVVRGWSSKDDAEAEGYLLASNRLTELGGWDDAALAEMLGGLDEAVRLAAGWAELPTPGPSRDQLRDEARQTLAERFVIPPFSVWDARQGYWQERKRAWLALGMRSDLGRPSNAARGGPGGVKNRSAPSVGANDPAFYAKKRAAEKRLGRTITTAEFVADHWEFEEGAMFAGTSVFDPVIAELAVRWFCPPGGTVVDPFAGGIVRGAVASWLGHPYVGLDLSAVQIEENERQWADVFVAPGLPAGVGTPRWVVGDARQASQHLPAGADLVLSCPPYYDLERYSEDPDDLANAATWAEFTDGYTACITETATVVADDRFVVWVVGEVRDDRGSGPLLGFVPETVHRFGDAGLRLYNECALLTSVGSLAVRAGRQFERARKLSRAHQAVLVFVKGDPVKAHRACGKIKAPAVVAEPGSPSAG